MDNLAAVPLPFIKGIHYEREPLEQHVFILFTGTNYKTEPAGQGSGEQGDFSGHPLSPQGQGGGATPAAGRWRPPSSRCWRSPATPLRWQPQKPVAHGEAGLSGLCMWYTSLSSSSGTCGAMQPPQLRRRPSCDGRQRHLVPPSPPATTPGLTSQ